MKKLLLSYLCIIGIMFSQQLNAQRLIPKQKGIEITGSIPITKGEKLFYKRNFGVEMTLSRYLKRGNYTFVGMSYEQQFIPYRSYEIPSRTMLLHIGYRYPILYDNGRNVFVYAGISALSGYEALNDDKKLLPDGATLLDRSRIVYGGAVHMTMEVFISDNIMFLIKAQGKMLFGSDLHRLRPAIAIGIKYHL